MCAQNTDFLERQASLLGAPLGGADAGGRAVTIAELYDDLGCGTTRRLEPCCASSQLQMTGQCQSACVLGLERSGSEPTTGTQPENAWDPALRWFDTT